MESNYVCREYCHELDIRCERTRDINESYYIIY